MKERNLFLKLTSYVLTFLIAFIGIVCGQEVAAKTAPKTLKAISAEKQLSGYISTTYFMKKRFSNGYIYCSESIHKSSTQNTTLTRIGAKDAGYTYIIKNGYPNKKFTGNSDKDYYITQTAIWWYMDSTAGTHNLTSAFKSSGQNKYGLRKYVKQLVTGAKKAKKAGYDKPSLKANVSSASLTLNGSNYESEYISVTAKNVPGKYKVSLTNAPKGAKIIDSDGKEVTSLKTTEKFKIQVPASKVSDDTTIDVKLTATGVTKKAYEYKPGSSSYQKVIPDELYEVEKTLNTSTALKLNVEKAKVSIIKKDSATNKALAGAKLQLSKDGKVVDTWTSTSEAHVINDLEAGTYTLKELEAPEGYVLNSESVTITLKDGDNKEVEMVNTKKEHRLEITKKDADTKQILPGAKLELSKDGKVIDTWVSTTEAHVLTNVAEGTYTLREVAAPAGYLLDTTPITVTITAKDEVKAIVMYNHKKEAKKHSIQIIKKDKETDKPLAGAKLQLVDADGNVVATWTSTNEAYIIDNLPLGTYTLQELDAPTGYVLNSEKVTFTVGEDDELKVVVLYNLKETPVPITDSNVSTLTMGIGFTAMLIGAYVVYRNKKKLV